MNDLGPGMIAKNPYATASNETLLDWGQRLLALRRKALEEAKEYSLENRVKALAAISRQDGIAIVHEEVLAELKRRQAPESPINSM